MQAPKGVFCSVLQNTTFFKQKVLAMISPLWYHLRMENNTITTALLSNGQIITGAYRVGERVRTQWGEREVVSVLTERVPVAPHPETQAEIAQRVE